MNALGFHAVVLVVSIGLLLLVRSTHEILLLIFLGVVLAVFIGAVAGQVAKITRLSRRWAMALTLIIGAGAVGLLLFWSVPRIAADAAQLSAKIPQALSGLEQRLNETEWGSQVMTELSVLSSNIGLSAENLRRFLGFFSTLFGGLTGALIIAIFGIYFASEPRIYVNGLLKLVPPRHRDRGGEVLDQMAHALRWWLVGRLVSMSAVFVFTWLGLFLLGRPLSLMLAVIAGLLSAIPNIGPVLALIPALLLAFGAGAETALHVLLLYLAIQFVESYTVTPLIERRAVLVPPGLLLGMQLLMGALAGFIGLFAAPPLLVVSMVLVKMLYVHDHNREDIRTV